MPEYELIRIQLYVDKKWVNISVAFSLLSIHTECHTK